MLNHELCNIELWNLCLSLLLGHMSFSDFSHVLILQCIDLLLEGCQEHIKNEGAQLLQFARLDVPIPESMPN